MCWKLRSGHEFKIFSNWLHLGLLSSIQVLLSFHPKLYFDWIYRLILQLILISIWQFFQNWNSKLHSDSSKSLSWIIIAGYSGLVLVDLGNFITTSAFNCQNFHCFFSREDHSYDSINQCSAWKCSISWRSNSSSCISKSTF
jgi:hypothetical protein